MRRKRPGVVLPEMMDSLLSKAATEPYPAVKIEVPQGFRGKIKVEDPVCIGCSLCAVVCPPACIDMVDSVREVPRGDRVITRKRKPVVHLLSCIQCGLCEEACPTDPKAIHLTEAFRGAYRDLDVVVE
jgi:NADH-quinone oxidoreductase subunit I